MIEPRKGDSLIVAHARRELEMADAFKKTEDYDGKLGRAALDLVKTFESWAGEDHAIMQVLANVFNNLIGGELLSPPTTDPDEWEVLERDDKVVWRNRRSPFYMSGDAGVSYKNMANNTTGRSKNHLTGEEYPQDENQTTDEGVGAPDGAGKEAGSDEGSNSDSPSEAGRRGDPGVDTESVEKAPRKKSSKAKPKAGKDK